MIVEALETGFRQKNARIKIGTAFHTDLIEFILPAFEKILEDCPEDIKPVYKVQQSKYIIPHTKSEIKLVGLDRKPNGLRGNAIDFIGLDEAGFISNLDYIYKSVIIPATSHRPDCKVFLLSTPPSTPAHDFVDYAQKAEMEGGYAKFTIYDNPMLGPKDHARLMYESGGETSTTWRREYLCERVTDSDLAIIGEWKDEYVEAVLRDDYFKFYHKYISMDLGLGDFTAVLYGYYDYLKARLVIEDEWVVNKALIPNINTEIIAKGIRDKQDGLWEQKPYLKVSDNNNPLLLQDLGTLHQLHFIPTDKGTLEEMINAVKLMVNRGQIIVHPKCTQLIGCLKYGVWNKKRSAFERSKVYGHFDSLASLVYMVRNLNKTTNPIPANFQVDHNNQILFQANRESQGARKLKEAFGFSTGGRKR